MNEVALIEQRRQEFTAQHPLGDGWKLYEIATGVALDMGLRYLLDYVRDTGVTVVGRNAFGVAADYEILGRTVQVSLGDGRMDRDVRSEWDTTAWNGLMQLEWDGARIDIVSYFIYSAGTYNIEYIIATQSHAALQSLMQALQNYARERIRKEPHCIHVVNGPDIPILPLTWDDIVLPPGYAEEICANVTAFFSSQARYARLGIPYRRGLLLAGPPGTGKTLTLRVLAATIPVRFVAVKNVASLEDATIEHAFDFAHAHAPAVIVLEDLDKMMQMHAVSLAHFLNLLDGLTVLRGVLVIATCNEPEALDPALLHRPSRFDRIWYYPMPSYAERVTLLRMKGRAYFSDAALDAVARKTDGFTMAYVQEVVVNAILDGVQRGTELDDSLLLKSLRTLEGQRATAGWTKARVLGMERVGFCRNEG